MPRRRATLAPLTLLALLASACLSSDGSCPRPGLDSARRCKRLCVLGAKGGDTPLDCHCADACLCWEMPGHVSRPAGHSPQ